LGNSTIRRTFLTVASLAAALAGVNLAADPNPTGPGWTGTTNPKDVIAARQQLMMEMERLMQPIDSFTIGEAAKPADLTSAATTISKMLLALPHLFPPTTNLYDPKAETPTTIALPAIWQSFPAFYAFATAASASAASMATKKSPDDLKAAASSLRATCDACHTPYLRAYVAETASPADEQFDFDSVFDSKGDKDASPPAR
jgi:cytochrome c556